MSDPSNIYEQMLVVRSQIQSGISCSKSSSQPSSDLPAKIKNLGVIEFTEGVPQHFAGKSFTATSTQLTNGILVDFVIEATNANGTVQVLSKPRVLTQPGLPCAIWIGDGDGVELTPKLKSL